MLLSQMLQEMRSAKMDAIRKEGLDAFLWYQRGLGLIACAIELRTYDHIFSKSDTLCVRFQPETTGLPEHVDVLFEMNEKLDPVEFWAKVEGKGTIVSSAYLANFNAALTKLEGDLSAEQVTEANRAMVTFRGCIDSMKKMLKELGIGNSSSEFGGVATTETEIDEENPFEDPDPCVRAITTKTRIQE